MNASGAVTPADVKGFVSTLVDMLPQRRCVFQHGNEERRRPVGTIPSIELLQGQ